MAEERLNLCIGAAIFEQEVVVVFSNNTLKDIQKKASREFNSLISLLSEKTTLFLGDENTEHVEDTNANEDVFQLISAGEIHNLKEKSDYFIEF